MLNRVGKKVVGTGLVVGLLLGYVPVQAESGEKVETVQVNDQEIFDWGKKRELIEDVSKDKGFFKEGRVTESQFMGMMEQYLGLQKTASEEGTDKDEEVVEKAEEVDRKDADSSGTKSSDEGVEEQESASEGETDREESVDESSEKEVTFAEGFIERDVTETYDSLRSVGIMARGTNYEEKRTEVLTVREGATILISTFSDEEFITHEDRVEKFLKEADVQVEDVEDWLTRGTAVKMLYQFHKQGSKVETDVEVDPLLGSYETYYFGDWNKRMFYYYPLTGLMVSVSKWEDGIEREKAYVSQLSGEEEVQVEGKEQYQVVVRSFGEKAIDVYGYAVLTEGSKGTVEWDKKERFVGLRGDAKLSTVVSGEDVQTIKVLLGSNVIELPLSQLERFPGDRFISDRGNGLEWNWFYKGETVTDSVEQVESLLFDAHVDEEEEKEDSKDDDNEEKEEGEK